VVSLLETEEKDLKERLAVLEEQKFMVEEMVKSAHGARRFEEVSALSRNLDELTSEIQGLRKKIGDVEKKWEVAYRNGA
jgi:regulator of replication initiation timing